MKEIIEVLKNRPPEVRSLLNPAFCGFIIYTSILEYNRITKTNINVTLLFLILPIILNEKLRDLFSKNKTKNLIYIVNDNKYHFKNFDYIFNYYIEYTFEAIYFLVMNNHLEIKNETLIIKSKKIKFNDSHFKKYSKDISILMKIFSKVKSESTIYSTLGVNHED